jgi:hypothetical protein
MTDREVLKQVRGMPTSDGAGVKLTRVIGQPALGDLDPFLMLDEFGTDNPGDYIAGFPAHPHRGFETVTYMLDGRMRHKDNHGHEGVLVPGAVQWMTAGRGIVHSEMPEQQQGRMRGFQLWLNLPARAKMMDPAYQEFGAAMRNRGNITSSSGRCHDRPGTMNSGAERRGAIRNRVRAESGPQEVSTCAPTQLPRGLWLLLRRPERSRVSRRDNPRQKARFAENERGAQGRRDRGERAGEAKPVKPPQLGGVKNRITQLQSERSLRVKRSDP